MIAADETAAHKELETRAEELADGFVEKLKNSSDTTGGLPELLYDLKFDTVKQAAIIQEIDLPPQELLDLSDLLPGYEILSFYRSRASFISLGLAVLLGWFAGGLLSTILGFLSLGGEILRPLCIFGCIWLEDYISANPKARRILLTVLGLGGLARFAASITMGLVRLGSLSSIRSLIFGSMPKPGLLKSAWLWLGAIFILAFFAKRPAGIDFQGLSSHLAEQILQRLKFSVFFLNALKNKDQIIASLSEENSFSSSECPKNDCGLALALMQMLPQMPPNARNYLRHKLEETGYAIPVYDTDILIWNEEQDRSNYDTLGYVKDGDRCKILKKPVSIKGKLIKGLVQRLPEV